MSDTTHTLSDFVGHRKTFRNNQPTLAFPELSWKNMSGVTDLHFVHHTLAAAVVSSLQSVFNPLTFRRALIQ